VIPSSVGIGGGGALLRRRERPPYEWWGAASSAIALAMIPWVPLSPFFRVSAQWAVWFAVSVLGGNVTVATHEPSLVVFLPLIGAALLSYPLLALVAQRRRRSRIAIWFSRSYALFLFLMAGIEIGEIFLAADVCWEIGRIVLACMSGLSIAAVGIELRRAEVDASSWMRALTPTLIASGLCIATFVLLPIGLVGLLVSYLLIVGVLLQGESDGVAVADS